MSQSDERILGDSDFVQSVYPPQNEQTGSPVTSSNPKDMISATPWERVARLSGLEADQF